MKYVILLFFIFTALSKIMAQRGPNDTIRVSAIIVGKDTLIHKWLNEFYVRDRAPKWARKQLRAARKEREAYDRLRYNVYLTYPYAVAASYILKDVDSVMATLYSKEAKSQFKRRKEDQLNKRFKDELKNLTISQGQILVKLIARQTGRPCYAIIKDLKGGFNAGLFQAIALLFDNNLRNTYDALGEDAAIEQIVQEIEAHGHFEVK